MGLWQKLLGWLNPSAPTATPALPAAEHLATGGMASGAPVEPGFRAAHEPAFDPAAEWRELSPQPLERDMDAALAPDGVPAGADSSDQPDLFEAAAQAEAERLAQIPEVIQQPALRDALSVYAGMAWDRQIDFAEHVGDRPWSADTQQGVIAFGDDLRFRMQVLGSYAFESGSWQWIWANTQAEVAPGFTEVARQLLGFGNAQKLALFTQPRSIIREEDLHVIGLIAAGADESAGYYLGNYGDGIMLALVDPGHGLPVPADTKPERVMTVVPQLLSQFELNHRTLLRHYMQAKGFTVKDAGSQIGGERGAQQVNATLDGEGRITAINGSLGK